MKWYQWNDAKHGEKNQKKKPTNNPVIYSHHKYPSKSKWGKESFHMIQTITNNLREVEWYIGLLWKDIEKMIR